MKNPESVSIKVEPIGEHRNEPIGEHRNEPIGEHRNEPIGDLRYNELVDEELRESSRLMNLLAIIFFPLFSVLDYFAQPAHFKELSIIRFSTSAAFLFFYVSHKRTRILNDPFLFSLLLLCIGSLSITLMCLVMNGYESPYYAGVNLVMLTAVMIFPWGARRMIIAVSMIMGIYFIGVFMKARFSIEHPETLLNNSFFMITTAVIGVTSAYFMDRLRRESFQRFLKIEQAQAALKKHDEIKTKFFANVSHELRTPVSLILGPVRKLMQTASAQQQYDLDVIERNAQQLLGHIGDLLDVARIEAGKSEIQYAKVDVAKLARRVASHFEILAQERQIDFGIEVPELLSAEVDPDKVERVFMNLLSNAFKFTPIQGKIHFCLTQIKKTLMFSVQDNGPGVQADLKEMIFERFFQAEQPLIRKHSGTGLGLSIVKEFIELHHGSIQVLDVSGSGVEFRVSLPLNAPANTVLQKDWTPLKKQSSHPAFKTYEKEPDTLKPNLGLPLVLVVEDNVDMNGYLTSVLSNHFRVVSSLDGKEGIEKALAIKPDLILSDLMMPGYSGVDLLKAIRANSLLDSIPLLFLTAKADDDLKISLLQNGAQDYILKPFLAEELLARVSNWAFLHRTEKVLRQNLDEVTAADRGHGSENIETLALEVAEKKRQLQDALAVVQSAREEAENAVKLREEFLSIASHELKTPVTVMSLQTELFKRKIAAISMSDQGAEMISKQIETTESQLKRLGRLVEGMLDFSVMNSNGGEIVLVKSKIDLVKLLKQSAEQMSDSFRRAGVTVSFQGALLDDTSNGYVRTPKIMGCWDPLKMEQVIINLLTNALKYGEGKPIELQASCSDGKAVFQVIDHGMGISKENQRKIFNRFARAVSARHFGGLGLGLYIVKQIVDSHGGEITVKSEPGLGSTFTVTLPL